MTAGLFPGKLGLDGSLKMDICSTVPPPTPAPRSTRAAPTRRRVRHEASSSEDDQGASSVPVVPMTPSMVSTRSQRASKTAAMSKMATKTTIEFSDEGEIAEESDMTSEDTSDNDCEE